MNTFTFSAVRTKSTKNTEQMDLQDGGVFFGRICFQSDADLKRINLVLASPKLLDVVQELFDDLGTQDRLSERGRHFESICRAALMAATPENFDP